jgi:hypothetical protein
MMVKVQNLMQKEFRFVAFPLHGALLLIESSHYPWSQPRYMEQAIKGLDHIVAETTREQSASKKELTAM